MHIPDHFKEEDNAKILKYIREYSFGQLVLADNEGIDVNHIPFHLSSDSCDSVAQLQCHVSRNNPIWRRLQGGVKILAVFQGPNAYISPSWYLTNEDTGRVVPTWNYLAIHVEGYSQITHDPIWLKQHLRQLIDQHESEMKNPWSLDSAATDFTDDLVKSIVGVEIKVVSMKCMLKANQNQTDKNRAGVRAGLEAREAMSKFKMSKFIV